MRKLRLTDLECSSTATQISPTRLKPPKNDGFRHRFAAVRVLADFQRRSMPLDLKLCLRPKADRKTPLATNIASRPKGIFFGRETGTWASQRTCWRARRPNRLAKPATGWFQSARATLSPCLVRLGRLGAVMATRVKNVQNGPKNIFPCLSPLCRRPKHTTNDDATTPTRNTKPASYATARPVPRVCRVGDGHGGAV